MRLFGVYGSGGYAREVMPLVRKILNKDDMAVFVDDNIVSKYINGHECITLHDFLGIEARERSIVVAVADPKTRKKLVQKCESLNIGFFSVIAENAILMDGVEIGDGCIISPFCTITSNVQIGNHFHCNIYSYVAHDCFIGDFVTFAPKVCCNGNVRINDMAYIGTGALLKQGVSGRPLVIGREAVVGMGAVVIKDVPDSCTVVGNPAKPLVK